MQCLQVERVSLKGGPAASEMLIAGRRAAIYPGGDLVLAAKMAAPGKSTILLEGTYLGQPFSEEYPIEVENSGELAGTRLGRNCRWRRCSN